MQSSTQKEIRDSEKETVEYTSKKLKNKVSKTVDKEVQYTSEPLRDDKKSVLIDIKQNNLSLEFVSERLRDDKEIALAAIKKDIRSLEYVSERLRDDKEIVFKALQYAYSGIRKNIKMLSNAWLEDENEYLKLKKNIFEYCYM